MNQISENRRQFLKRAAIGAAAFPFLVNCGKSTLAQKTEGLDVLNEIKENAIQDTKDEWWGARNAPDEVRWKTKLVEEKDEGDRLLISGTIYKSDGRTPAPNVLIYFYHTDIRGLYGRNGQHRHGRFRGWMLTDHQGRYSLFTIKPASYPDTTNPAHIHMTLTGVDFKEDWVDSILFKGDPFITARQRKIERGGFDPILKLEKDSENILRGTRDIQLEKI